MSGRRLFIPILLSQIGCLAVGLAFHQIYLTSSIAQAAADEARSGIERQFASLSPLTLNQSAASLRRDSAAWQRLSAAWRTAAQPDDRMFLLDRDGHVLAAANASGTVEPPVAGQTLDLSRRSHSWGYFDRPIRGTIATGDGGQQVVIAKGLATVDGYLVIADTPSQSIETPVLTSTLWAACGITLVWTLGLSAATLFLVLTFNRRKPAAEIQHEVEALKQAQALVRTQETVIFGLAKLSDSRDPETGMHLERIAQFSSLLAAELRQRPGFRDRITPGFVQLIGISSALHDIGKVGVEDAILRKPGSLSVEERQRMQRHTEIGAECLRQIERRLGSSNFLQMAQEIVSAHHEWWDGQGYPLGLAGEQIPLSARIVAVADVYDALRSKRVYKEALPHVECVALIAEAAGTQFDPRVVDAFLQIEDKIDRLAEQLKAPGRASPFNDRSLNDSLDSEIGASHVSAF